MKGQRLFVRPIDADDAAAVGAFLSNNSGSTRAPACGLVGKLVGELVAVGYVPIPVVLIFLAWLACAGQFAALATGRYAPYPSRAERERSPLLRSVGRKLLIRPRHQTPPAEAEEPRAEAGG